MRIDACRRLRRLFEVKDALEKKGTLLARGRNSCLLLSYDRESYRRQTAISATAPAKFDKMGLSFAVHIEPQGEWTTDFDVIIAMWLWRNLTRPKYERGQPKAQPNMERSLDRWLNDAPRLESTGNRKST